MKPYDAEILVLGTTLKFGSKAAALSSSILTADKFIFESSGGFGREYGEIWQAIIDLTLQAKEPTVTNLRVKLPAYADTVNMLADRVTYAWHVHEFNGTEYLEWVAEVDKHGRVYRRGLVAQQQSLIVKDMDSFTKTLEQVKDIDQWENEKQADFQCTSSGAVTGYTHVSAIVPELRQEWQDIKEGKATPLVDSGMPSLMKNKLFPKKKLSVLHGLSGSGKSSFAFQTLLGTALWLKRFNLPGCVAVNSLEMDQYDLVQRMASILAGVDVSKLLDNSLSAEELAKLDFWAGVVETLPIFVDDTNFITTDAMTYRATGLHVSPHGPVVQLATDYGELFGDDEDTEEQRVNAIFRNQRGVARLTGASVLAISQSTNDKSVSGKTFIAGPDGTRYSKGILQAADVLVEIWNPPQILKSGRTIVAPDGYTLDHPYLMVQKNRGASIGQAIPFGWKAESTTFLDQALDHYRENSLFTHLEALGYKYEEEGAW